MSLFHLYAAVEIVPAQVLRPVHVGLTLLLVFLLFPIAARYRNRLMWWDVVCARARRRDDRLPARRRRRLLGPQHAAERTRRLLRRRVRAARAGGVRRTSGWIMLFVIGLVPRLRLRRPLAAGTVGAPRLRRVEHVGLPVPDARRHLRHRRRRVVVAHHPVHDLRRVPAAVGRRQVLPRLELRRDGRASTAGAGRTVVLASFLLGGPSGSGVATTVTIGSVAYPMLERAGYGKDAAGGLARGGRTRRDHLAAGARRGRVPHRRVPEDQLSRRAADGDDPDAPLLPVAVPDGRARRAQVRHARGGRRGARGSLRS